MPPVNPNAGPFEKLNERATEVLDFETFTGCRFHMQNMMHPHFITMHILELGKKEQDMTGKEKQASEYSFLSFIKTKRMLLRSQVSSASTSVVTHFDVPGVNFQYQAQCSSNLLDGGWMASVTGTARDMCIAGKLGTTSQGLSFTQPLTHNLATGVEMAFNENSHRLKWIARLDNPNSKSTWVASLSSKGTGKNAVLNYTRTIATGLDLSTELNLSYDKSWRPLYRLGYMHKVDTNFVRGMVESSGKLSCTVEETVAENIMISFSTKADYVKKSFDFGIGISFSV